MSKKVYYRYNPTTETYQRVYPSRRERFFTIAFSVLGVVAIFAVIFIALYLLFLQPTQEQLTEENTYLSDKIYELQTRLDEATKVMDAIAERDNNFYRVIMQIDPVTAAQRYAGLNAIPGNEATYSNERQAAEALYDKLALFERQLAVQSESFDQLAKAIDDSADRIAHIPSIQPVNERDMTQMASGYGYRKDPIYGTTRHHDGMDFAAPIGTPVYATGDGVVTFASRRSGYGNVIDIDHGYNYTTRYAHLSEVLVKRGQKVHRGDLIGRVGNTGKSTGSHLHYEVRLKGLPQNPVNYYFADLTPEEYVRMVNDAENAGHVMD